jgi:hypothetical protein
MAVGAAAMLVVVVVICVQPGKTGVTHDRPPEA